MKRKAKYLFSSIMPHKALPSFDPQSWSKAAFLLMTSNLRTLAPQWQAGSGSGSGLPGASVYLCARAWRRESVRSAHAPRRNTREGWGGASEGDV